MNKLEYIKDSSTGIETVSYENVNISYPEHTHIGHIVMGIVTDGIVEIKIGQQIFVCKKGQMFSVAPNVPHSIISKIKTYSMISICIPEKTILNVNLI